jgi:MFS family permease
LAEAGAGIRGRREVLRDWRFLILVPTMIGPAAIVTGYFFHQRLLAERQGWGLETLAVGIGIYALAGIVATLTVGPLVDRFRGTRVSRVHLLPLAAASLVLLGSGGAGEAPVFFALVGITSAANGVVVPAVLAELFGTARLGTVRALAAALMVAGSALTPGLFGFLFDAGMGRDGLRRLPRRGLRAEHGPPARPLTARTTSCARRPPVSCLSIRLIALQRTPWSRSAHPCAP